MKKVVSIILVLLLSLSIVGCSKSKKYISYSVYPIGYLLNRIVGDKIETISIQENELAQVANLVDNYEAILNDSSYFFHIGDLEPYMELYKDEISSTEAEIIDLSELNAIYKFQRYSLVYVDGKESYIEAPYYNSPIFDKLDIYSNDLALWIDPISMLSMAERIYDILSANYVEAASFFKENYESLKEDLISLDASYQALSTKLKNNNKTIKFVTMSANLGNWQKAYGFQVYPVCMSKYGSIPTDEELAIIKERIIADNVRYIAYEPNMTDDMINLFNSLEKELGLMRINLSNLSSLTPSQIGANKDYLSLMHENLNVLENLTTDVLTKEATNGEITQLINED